MICRARKLVHSKLSHIPSFRKTIKQVNVELPALTFNHSACSERAAEFPWTNTSGGICHSFKNTVNRYQSRSRLNVRLSYKPWNIHPYPPPTCPPFLMQCYNLQVTLCSCRPCAGGSECDRSDQGQVNRLPSDQVIYWCLFPTYPREELFLSCWKHMEICGGNSFDCEEWKLHQSSSHTHTLTQRYLNVLWNFMGIQEKRNLQCLGNSDT